jgi:hypothetical protein
MNDRGSTSLRTLAFGELDLSVWGAAWIRGSATFSTPTSSTPTSAASVAPTGQERFVALGAGDRTIVAAALLHDGGESEDWRLEGDGVELTISATGAAVAGSGADGPSGFHQLCRVHGRVRLDGTGREIDCIGRRGGYPDGVVAERLDSVRDVSAWFEAADGLAVVALRPGKSRGQETDLVTAVVFGSDVPHTITDPRLSTTYTASGQPLRAGVELWLGDDEEQQYPRRALGEAVGAGATGRVGRFEVLAQPFRWQSRGREGAGVYLLARQG